MRITNNIMINNSLSNINKNKVLMDKINTQINTTKKFQRPSDDPIAAIRALRLRSTESELTQYLKKNIEDANSWMEVTDGALNSLSTVEQDIIAYYNNGVSEYQTTSDRDSIITTLKEFREQIYADGNADNAGRTIFTGYRTDDTLTFMKDVKDEYTIKEHLTLSDVRDASKVIGVDTEGTGNYRETDVINANLHMVMLGYTDLNATEGLTIASGTNDILNGAPVQVRSKELLGNTVYNLQDDEIVFVPETGELIFGGGYYDVMNTDDEFTVTYTKTGFKEGDLKPENYYDCTNKTENEEYTNYVEKTTAAGLIHEKRSQSIEYNINFNQKIKINVEGKDVLPASLGRDLDIAIAAAEDAAAAHIKVTAVQKKIDSATSAGDTAEVERLTAMKAAVELEVAYAEDNLTKAFKNGITLYQNHQALVNTQSADIGSRMNRLTLNQERLESQSLTVADLKSSNEDTNLTEAAVLFKTAQDVYDASLAAAAKVVQKTLLDFI